MNRKALDMDGDATLREIQVPPVGLSRDSDNPYPYCEEMDTLSPGLQDVHRDRLTVFQVSRNSQLISVGEGS